MGVCSRNVVVLIEDLHRVMNTTKSASLFFFMLDSTSVDRSFFSAGVASFQCPWKLTRTLLGSVTAREWRLFSQVAYLKCLWDFAAGIDIYEPTNSVFCVVSMLWLYAIACGVALGFFI